MAISLFLFPFSSALDFSFNSPEKAESEEPFTASISASVSAQYDVKIFIQDENNLLVSQIFSNGWKNPFYFLKSAFPNQTEFQIKAINASGNYQICARLRESGKTSFTEKCSNIIITKSEKQEETPALIPSLDAPEKNNSKKYLADNNKQINYQDEKLNYIENNSQKQKIILISNFKNEVQNLPAFTTKYEKTRNYILYSFTAFCIVIIILLALRQL